MGNFLWSIADQLRGVYKPHQYGNVILPMTILPRLDCILEPTRNEVALLAQEFYNPAGTGGMLSVAEERAAMCGTSSA